MPDRYVNLKLKHIEAALRRDAARKGIKDRLRERVTKFIEGRGSPSVQRLTSFKDSVFSEWEMFTGRALAAFVIEAWADVMIEEIPALTREHRVEMDVVSEIGPEGMAELAPINAGEIKKRLKAEIAVS